MSGAQGKRRYVKKVNIKHVLLIAVILAAVLSFGKLTHFFGKYTGEVADDNRGFNKQAAAWTGSSRTAVLDGGAVTAYLPAEDSFHFDTEQTEQALSLGNPAENELPMNFTLWVQGQALYSSGILEPGKGVERVQTNTYFEPNTYEATLIYTFYRLDGHRLKTLDTVEQAVTIEAVGSGEKYQAGMQQQK